MNSFTITDDHFFITNKNNNEKIHFNQLQSVRITYRYTLIQRLIKLITNINKKSYKLNILFVDNKVKTLKINSEEKDFLKPKLQTIKDKIDLFKKSSKVSNSNDEKNLYVA